MLLEYHNRAIDILAMVDFQLCRNEFYVELTNMFPRLLPRSRFLMETFCKSTTHASS